MAADVGWFRQTLSNISNEIEVINNLSELKIALTSVNTMQIKTLALNLDLGVIFDCLNSSDNQQIELGCHILEELLPCLEPAVLLNKYGVAMHRALAHPNETVKQVVLTEMCRAVKDSDLVSRMGDQQALLLSVVECVGHDNMSVAKIAISFLVWMGQTPSYLGTLLSPQLLQAFNAVKKKNETTRFRVFEVIVEVSAISSPGLEACHNSGLLTELLNETKQKSDILTKLTAIELITKLALTHHGMDYLEKYGVTDALAQEIVGCGDGSLESLIIPEVSAISSPGLEACHNSGLLTELLNETKQKSDILTKLTAIELITKLALTHHGMDYLEKYGVTDALAQEIVGCGDGSLESLIIPGIMKFFGNIAQFWPRDIFEKYSKVIGAIFEFSNSADANLAAIALETIGYVATTPEGKLCLNKHGDAMSSVMRKLNQLITSAPAEVRVRPLNTIANIIGLESFRCNPTLSFMNICHLPFAELRLAGFLILQKMSIQVWGQKHVLNCPGLIEFLMDRDVEPTLECKTSKFQIVEFLVGSNTTETVFGEILYKRLVDFVRDGPCYVQALTEVAIEGAA
ncbi:26S proteasome non-ATPase regulatory subunit 5 [Nilaparvata lugens]|uniref:26S proteasome non-ATPase regulatory subunit 5 n=1 Tax=Nilaparvata lugens TaxID=108931 RepID=UPI00193D0A6B|nr:26S proteasome non-ATPase regulatory subunit 5 [Nilaparvata lugens]